MTVDPKSRETDVEAIGVHVQDQEGVCISLQKGDEWHWISDACADALLMNLAALPQFEAIQEAVRRMVQARLK